MKKEHNLKNPGGALLALLLLASAAGCGGSKEGELAIEPNSERQERSESGVGTGVSAPEGSSGQIQLTGARTANGAFSVACGLFSDKGLQITFDRPGTDTPQVVLRIDDYMAAGSYSGTVIVRDHYSSGQDAPQSIGSGQVRITNARASGPPEGSVLSGSFEGAYGGALGSGKVSGTFEGCSTNTSS